MLFELPVLVGTFAFDATVLPLPVVFVFAFEFAFELCAILLGALVVAFEVAGAALVRRGSRAEFKDCPGAGAGAGPGPLLDTGRVFVVFVVTLLLGTPSELELALAFSFSFSFSAGCSLPVAAKT